MCAKIVPKTKLAQYIAIIWSINTQYIVLFYYGAGNGNRTRRSGLGSRGFTTRLYLRTASRFVRNDIILTYFFRLVNTKRGISFTDFHGGSGRGSEKRENRIHPE